MDDRRPEIHVHVHARRSLFVHWILPILAVGAYFLWRQYS